MNHRLIIAALIIVIAAWLAYALYHTWRGARGADCSSCALAGDFDYRSSKNKKPDSPVVSKATGRRIITDEAEARRLRESFRANRLK
ncbi:MAG: hypothetical protein SPI25_01335 [Dialister sp.]|nr:hypothetical protein [Dialister sp.]